MLQLSVFVGLTALIAVLTYLKCRGVRGRSSDAREYFLAGGGLSWIFVGGSILMTNINTDTLTGFNGPQVLVMAWYELCGIIGLVLLAMVFLPVYYHYKCTTVTELLEQRYDNKHLRAMVSAMFLLGNLLIFLPTMLYTSSLMLTQLFDLELPLVAIAAVIAAIGAAYAIFGGLRAVAVSDTFNTVLVLGMSLVVVVLALHAVRWDLSGLPPERVTLIGGPDSPVPWPVLFTGMIFMQLYYFSTNQNITQRALAAPTLREAKKGVYAAALIRLPIVPLIVVVPGLCAFKLYGELGDATYGHLVSQVLPGWLQGAFAAAMVAAVVTSFNSLLNASAALYVCDLHQRYFNPQPRVGRWSVGLSLLFAVLALVLVPVYQDLAAQEGIMNAIQSLMASFSMPILSAFITGMLFRNVDARAIMLSLVLGVVFYLLLTRTWNVAHFIHVMLITVVFCVGVALLANLVFFGRRAVPVVQEFTALLRKRAEQPPSRG